MEWDMALVAGQANDCSGFGRFAIIPASRLRSSSIMIGKAIAQTHEPGTKSTDRRSTYIFLCQPSSAIEVLTDSELQGPSRIQVSSVRSRKTAEAENDTESTHGFHMPTTRGQSRKPPAHETNKPPACHQMQTYRLPPPYPKKVVSMNK